MQVEGDCTNWVSKFFINIRKATIKDADEIFKLGNLVNEFEVSDKVVFDLRMF